MGRVARIVAPLLLLFGVLPTLVVIVASFSSSRVLKFPPSGPSLEPYAELLRSDVLRPALARSVVVAIGATLLALPIGVAAIMALYRHRVRLRFLWQGYLILGFSTPLVVSGMAFLVLYIQLGFFGSLSSIALSLTIVNLPFLLFSVTSAVVNLNPELEEAAATLGADRAETLILVTIPALMPGILTGSLLVFVFSLTEFLVSLILATVTNQTLPVALFGSLRGAVSPVLAAAGGIYILIAGIVVFAISRVQSIEEFLIRKG